MALLKPYYDAGLRDMAATAGYRVNQIQSCSQFKRVHNFILEVWEALYRCMLCKILSTEAPEELKQCDDTCGSQEKNSSVEFHKKIVIYIAGKYIISANEHIQTQF